LPKPAVALKRSQGGAVMTDRSSLGHWIRRFLLEYATSERNLSANTCASYRDMLVLLLPYLAKRKCVATDALLVTDLSAELVRSFLVYLEQERECCTATRNQRLASIHALARFIGGRSPQHVEWCAQIRMVQIKKGITTSLTYLEKWELDGLLAAPDQSSSQGRRDHALLLFLYNSGARASEAASLRIGDIEWHSKSVRITGKGSKQRRCPLWAATLEHLRHLAGQRSAEANLFVNCRGEPLTRYGIHTLVERYVVKLRALVPSLQGNGSARMSFAIQPQPICFRRGSTSIRSVLGLGTCRSTPPTSMPRPTLLPKKRALATLARGRTRRATGGWSRQPDVMAFLRAL